MAGIADESGEDLENMTDLSVCKERIVQLQADRERRLEATERLQEKLKALNNELAARRLEADQRRLDLKEEQGRNKEHQLELRDKGEEANAESPIEKDTSKVRNTIEDMMAEKAAGPMKKEKAKSEYGFRVFDETELMVEKSMELEGKEAAVDTILVTHQKPNSDDVRYHLSYRVAKGTASKKLREDACNYWNLSEVEYILVTVENSKVHDDIILQHCFRPNEDCRLILAPKDPRRTMLMDKELEATDKKIGKKKVKSKVPAAAAEDPSKKYNQSALFENWLQLKPGMWDFMTQRDKNVIDHVTRIKLRSICVYILFLISCLAVYYFVKPPSQGYYTRQGPLQAMTASRIDADSGEIVPAYHDIKTQEEAWKWLTYSCSDQLMTADSNLRRHNYLVGWLRVRMQHVKKSSPESCHPTELAPSDLYCVDENYNVDSAGTEDLDFLKLYWDGYNATTTSTTSTTTTTYEGQFSNRRLFPREFLARFRDELTPPPVRRDGSDEESNPSLFDADSEDVGVPPEARRLRVIGMAPWTDDYAYTSDIPTVAGTDGRSSKVNPSKFHEASKNSGDHGVAGLTGMWQKYGPDGYNLDYNLQYSNLTALHEAFRADMAAIKEREWFSNRTRSIIVSFTIYNGNYDSWTNNDFILEFPTSSVVYPGLHIDVFRSTMQDSSSYYTLFYLDVVRLIFALYILIFQVWMEISYARAREERMLFTYLLNPLGLADISIGFLMLFIFVVRQVLFGFSQTADEYLKDFIEDVDGFQSTAGTAAMWRMQLQTEAPLFCLILFRVFSLLRINRQIFIIWKTLWDSFKVFFPFCLVLTPIGFGLVVWAHALFHKTHRHYSQLPSSAMAVVMMIHGDVNLEDMFPANRADILIFGVLLYGAVWLLLVNSWIAVLVHVYQCTRVSSGYRPSDYRWKEKHYVVWMLFGPLAAFYFKFLRPRAEKPKIYAPSDDDD